jgi:hypothetical protein
LSDRFPTKADAQKIVTAGRSRRPGDVIRLAALVDAVGFCDSVDGVVGGEQSCTYTCDERKARYCSLELILISILQRAESITSSPMSMVPMDLHSRYMPTGLPTMVPTSAACADPLGLLRGLPHDAFLAAFGGTNNFFEMAARASCNPAMSLFHGLSEPLKADKKSHSARSTSKKVGNQIQLFIFLIVDNVFVILVSQTHIRTDIRRTYSDGE